MIFFCYRRHDVAHMTDRIAERLATRFGDEAIFKDVDSIQPGERWMDSIRRQLEQARVVVAIIGPGWEPAVDTAEETDHVAIELREAFERELPMLPVLVDREAPPAAGELPEVMGRLLDIQALRIRRNPDFDHDMERLAQACARHGGPRTWRESLASFARRPARFREAGMLQVVCFSLLAVHFAYYIVNNNMQGGRDVGFVSGPAALTCLLAVYLGAMFARGAVVHATVATIHIVFFLGFSMAAMAGWIKYDAGGALSAGHTRTLFFMCSVMAAAMLVTSALGLVAARARRRLAP